MSDQAHPQDSEWRFKGDMFVDPENVADSSPQPPAEETAENAAPEPAKTAPAEPPPTDLGAEFDAGHAELARAAAAAKASVDATFAAVRADLDTRWDELIAYFGGRRR